jgi:hypothetical protein
MVAGKLLVPPIRPGVGTVSILLVGRLMGGRSPDVDWAERVAAVRRTSKKQLPRFARNDKRWRRRNDKRREIPNNKLWGSRNDKTRGCGKRQITVPPGRLR